MAALRFRRLSNIGSLDTLPNKRITLLPPTPRFPVRKVERPVRKKKEEGVALPEVNLFQINVNGGLKNEFLEIMTESNKSEN